MVDFFISAVRYSEDGTAIRQVEIAPLNEPVTGNRGVGNTSKVPASFIRDLIRTGKIKIWTATKTINDLGWTYKPGSEVRLYGDKFLTTSPNAVERDNLGELSKF